VSRPQGGGAHDELADAIMTHDELADAITMAWKLPLDEAGNGGVRESQNARSPSKRTHTQAFVETPTPAPVGQHGHGDTLVESDRGVPGTTPQELTALQDQGRYRQTTRADPPAQYKVVAEARGEDVSTIQTLSEAFSAVLDGDGFPSATEQAMDYKIPWEQLPSATQDTLESLIWRGCCWPGPCPEASGSICPTTGKMESSPAPAWSSDSDKEDDPGNPPKEY
jgi:hypothetical protein